MILNPLYAGREQGTGLFEPRVLGKRDFAGVAVCDEVIEKAVAGSEFFRKRYDSGTLFPKPACEIADVDTGTDLLVHNYTGQCPVQTFELNPVKGCNVGCAYCLVNDGIHEETVVAYRNYHELVSVKLRELMHEEHFFYLSPKTEAFCETTLETGIAHRILQAFIEHFEEYPDSKARLFIASKAGAEALLYRYQGDSILDLFIRLRGKMQFNTSLSIFPDGAIRYIEPYSCSIDGRLEAVKLCRENGIAAGSALVQPIMINMLTDGLLDDFFTRL